MSIHAPFTSRAVARLLGAALAACTLCLAGAPVADAVRYSNPATIVINDAANADPDIPAKATPYPSEISISGFTGPVAKLTATLHGFHHVCSEDVDVLLLGPRGQNTILTSDAGDCNHQPRDPIELTFDDGGAPLPCLGSSSSLAGGVYAPTNSPTSPENCFWDNTDPDIFDPPAPAGPHAVSMATFNGIDPNGVWQLYVMDQFAADTGAIDGGWSLDFTVPAPTVGAPTVTGVEELGRTLTARSGAITNGGVASYQWNRCNLAGAACAPIAGANKNTYVPVRADRGRRLVVTETATNSGGAASANSEPSGAVGPPVVSVAATKRTQRVLRQGGIVAFARSNIAGRLIAAATVAIPNASKAYRFKPVRKAVRAGRKTRAKLTLSKTAMRAVRDALTRGVKLKAKLRLSVIDPNGGRTTKKMSIRLLT